MIRNPAWALIPIKGRACKNPASDFFTGAPEIIVVGSTGHHVSLFFTRQEDIDALIDKLLEAKTRLSNGDGTETVIDLKNG